MLSSNKKLRSDICTFSLHWILVFCVIISLFTGLHIAYDYHDSVTGVFAFWLSPLFVEGAVIEWHVWSSWFLTFIAIAYAVFIWWSQESIRIRLDHSIWSRIERAWSSGRLWSDVSAWFALNVIVYQIAFILIGLMALTGWMLYVGQTFGLGYDTVTTIHGLLSYSFVIYIIVHVLAQLKIGAFWKIFRPNLRHAVAATVAVVAAGTAVSAAYVFDRSDFSELTIAQIDLPPTVDGNANDAVWRKAVERTIHTHRGINLPDGEVPVQVAALHDEKRVYFKFRWPDPQRSQKHLPLVKHDDGWRVLQSEFEVNDEDHFYEDKFAVVIATKPTLGSGTVHLGQGLIPGPHRPTNRGMHYTDDGSLADMWHWKSVRTGSMSPGLMDDNFFGPPLPSKKDGARYTGGYGKDPKESGGYSLNWTKVDETKALNDTIVHPNCVPADWGQFQHIVEADLDPNVGDVGAWFMHEDDCIPYDPAKDDLPAGTILPAVIVKGSFIGDRGDVHAEAEWKDGYWTMEASRALDTGSEYDVAINRERDTYLWVSVFNHTQTRHSQHLHPLHLILQ